MPLVAIVDDSVLFTSPPGIIAVSEDPWANYYNGTSHRIYAGQSVSFSLHALGVLIFGPGREGSARFQWEETKYSTSYTEVDPPTRLANEFWGYRSGNPYETDGHGDRKDITYSTLTGVTEIDFILYEPSPSWPATGTILLLDDQDSWTTFTGSWNHTRDGYSLPTTFPTGNAIWGTISQTREPGAKFRASFVGSNVKVYGALQQVAGNVTIGYTIDGSFSNSVTLSPTSEGVNGTNWELNRLFFGHSDRSFYGDERAEHTLEVTVMEVTGDQIFSFDYLTFEGTPWTNVTSGRALSSPIGQGNSTRRDLAIGLGVSLPLALIIAVGIFFFLRRRKSKMAGDKLPVSA